MRLDSYLKEKMGSFPEKIERTAWLEKDDEKSGRYSATELQWKLINPSTDDERRNYNIIDGIAWKELKAMERKKALDFMEDKYNVSSIKGNTESYQAEVKLNRYDPKILIPELKRLKFKIIK
jgi:hypothetical protein